MKIILISGKAQHGKDTTAQLLKAELEASQHSAMIIHYADLLKYICKQYFNWDGVKDDQGRELLQIVGTDIIRKKDPEFWVDFVIRLSKVFSDTIDYILIPDVRFPNEIQKWWENNIQPITIRVERPEFDSNLSNSAKNHISETALDDFNFNYILINDQSEKELKENVKIIYNDIINS